MDYALLGSYARFCGLVRNQRAIRWVLLWDIIGSHSKLWLTGVSQAWLGVGRKAEALDDAVLDTDFSGLPAGTSIHLFAARHLLLQPFLPQSLRLSFPFPNQLDERFVLIPEYVSSSTSGAPTKVWMLWM